MVIYQSIHIKLEFISYLIKSNMLAYGMMILIIEVVNIIDSATNGGWVISHGSPSSQHSLSFSMHTQGIIIWLHVGRRNFPRLVHFIKGHAIYVYIKLAFNYYSIWVCISPLKSNNICMSREDKIKEQDSLFLRHNFSL